MAAILSAGVAGAEEVKIGIAAERYPPFASLDSSGDWLGWEIDATQAHSIAMAGFVNSDVGARCEIKGAVKDDPAILGCGVGAGVRKGQDDLPEAPKKGIAAILADGTHDKITSDYFSAGIY